MSCFFLAFPKNAQKNNAREVAKISLAFSLAFILQIQLAGDNNAGKQTKMIENNTQV
jgi:hypothetical protein